MLVLILVLLYGFGNLAIGIFIGRGPPPKLPFMKRLTEYADEGTLFLSPTDPKQEFEKSTNLEDFIKRAQP